MLVIMPAIDTYYVYKFDSVILPKWYIYKPNITQYDNSNSVDINSPQKKKRKQSINNIEDV